LKNDPPAALCGRGIFFGGKTFTKLVKTAPVVDLKKFEGRSFDMNDFSCINISYSKYLTTIIFIQIFYFDSRSKTAHGNSICGKYPSIIAQDHSVH
jgi:hypothetical protein